MVENIAELEPKTEIIEGYKPEALASPEATELIHRALNIVIDNTPDEFIWESTPTRGGGDQGIAIKNIRLMSQPSHVDKNGSKWGESFIRLNFYDDPYGNRQIMVTEDQGSGNPFGDVIGSLEAGAIVRKITRFDTAFLPNDSAIVRRSLFTFGPAQLEREQNAVQVKNQFTPVTNAQIDRIGEILANGQIHSHDGNNKLPPLYQLKTMSIAKMLLQD
jgi:hypothetical protein